MRVPLLLVCCSLVAGCTTDLDSGPAAPGDDGPDEDPPAMGTDFDRVTMEIAASYQSFSEINRDPYPSTLGAFPINLYVRGDTHAYRAIHPEDTAPSTPVAVGTVIVREVLNAQGQVAKLTLMAKGPKGYDPTLGDWWFGEADPQGVALVANGVVRLGRLADCHGCHVPRAAQDYLFGVPRAEQK